MKLFDVISGAIAPVTDLIDKLHTSDDERNHFKQAVAAMQHDITKGVTEYNTVVLQEQASVIRAEAQGESWLQRNWRPMTMVTFVVLIVLDTLGYTEFRLSDEAWELLKIGLGGYVIGRSVEKVAPVVSKMQRK